MENTVQTTSLNRRLVLRAAGLAATGAALAPFHAKAAHPAGKKIRMGIVGCGGRAKSVCNMMTQDGRYEITALADYFQGQMDVFAQQYHVPASRCFAGLDGYKRMLDAGGIDAVAVLSPPYFHPEQAAAAVDAGCHLYLAKPIAVDVPGVRSVGETSRKAAAKKQCVLVDFQTRAYGQFTEAARRVAAGEIGKIGYGEIEGSCGAFPLQVPADGKEAMLRNWLQYANLCGESIVEFGIHSIDLASLMINRPPRLASGFSARNFLGEMPGDVRDVWNATYEYEEGFKVLLRSKRFESHQVAGYGGIHFNLYGGDGALQADYSGEVLIRGKNFFSGDKFMGEKIRGIYDGGILRNLGTFHANIAEGNYANETVEPSMQSHYLALLGREAALRNGTVTWDELVQSNVRAVFDTDGLVR